jgi:hypothetical protein
VFACFSRLLFVFFALWLAGAATAVLFFPRLLHHQSDRWISFGKAHHQLFHAALAGALAWVPDADPIKRLCALLWTLLNLDLAAQT